MTEKLNFRSDGPLDEKPWITGCWGAWEVHLRGDVELQCSANQVITITKLYGPLSAYPVRITLKYDKLNEGNWVVEYQNPTTEEWEIKASWSCQENWPVEDET